MKLVRIVGNNNSFSPIDKIAVLKDSLQLEISNFIRSQSLGNMTSAQRKKILQRIGVIGSSLRQSIEEIEKFVCGHSENNNEL